MTVAELIQMLQGYDDGMKVQLLFQWGGTEAEFDIESVVNRHEWREDGEDVVYICDKDRD